MSLYIKHDYLLRGTVSRALGTFYRGRQPISRCAFVNSVESSRLKQHSTQSPVGPINEKSKKNIYTIYSSPVTMRRLTKKKLRKGYYEGYSTAVNWSNGIMNYYAKGLADQLINQIKKVKGTKKRDRDSQGTGH